MTVHERAADISRKMASMGFVPSRAQNVLHTEFVKDYVDAADRRARVSVMFLTDPSGRFEAKLDGFVVTMQARMSTDLSEIERRAPTLVRPDMLEIAKALGMDTGDGPAAMVEKSCHYCGAVAAEFYVVDRKPYCRSCHGKASATG